MTHALSDDAEVFEARLRPCRARVQGNQATTRCLQQAPTSPSITRPLMAFGLLIPDAKRPTLAASSISLRLHCRTLLSCQGSEPNDNTWDTS